MADPNKGRIAIKFGTPSTTSKPSQKSKPPPSALGKRPRAWANDDDDDADSDQDNGRHEAITGFDADGAETERRKKDRMEEKKEYVIQKQPNRDWRAEMKAQRGGRGKNLLPEEARQAQNGQTVTTERTNHDSGMKWGLNIMDKKEEEGEKVKDEPEVKKEEDDDTPMADTSVKPDPDAEEDKKQVPARTADDEAMDALLGRNPADTKPAAIIKTEGDAFQRDIQEAGEASTLADYEAMPVEEFGAALLRGMGWDGKERGTMRHTQVKRRPAKLGLGAKELKEAEDLGGWNQGGGKKRSRPRLDEYRREESKRKEARDSRREDSYKRERERERDGDRHRNRDRDRDRDYNRDRDRDRRRDYDRDRRR